MNSLSSTSICQKVGCNPALHFLLVKSPSEKEGKKNSNEILKRRSDEKPVAIPAKLAAPPLNIYRVSPLFFSGPSRNVFKYYSPAGMIILCDGLLATKNVMAALTVKTHKKTFFKKNTTQMFLGVRIVQCRLCGWA